MDDNREAFHFAKALLLGREVDREAAEYRTGCLKACKRGAALRNTGHSWQVSVNR